MINTLLWMSI
ncbi:hypothetical protein LINPERPRIM_LOCUS8951 [Linum perenne]